MKNVRQTELIVDLRDAILQVCRYFIDCDESFASSVNLQVIMAGFFLQLLMNNNISWKQV